MNHQKLILAVALLIQFGCFPLNLALPTQPKPFQAMPQNNSDATNQLAKEDNRLLHSQSKDPMPQLLDALLKMGCTITASDSSTKLVSFERSQKEPESPKIHRGLGYDSATMTGTIRLSQENQDFRCVLVLTGKINWRSDNGTIVETLPRLSPDEHKRFFDELFSKF